MINVASIRAAARAAPGDVVGLTKVQLEQLLTEIEAARRRSGVFQTLETSAGATR